MSRISDALNSVSGVVNSAAVAVKTKLGFMPTIEKATVVVETPMAENTQAALKAKQETPVAQKTRFERFKELSRNNPATSIALLASAIFAAVYGVDKYLQHRQLKNLENHLGSAGDLDQFPGASAILAADFDADDRFMGEAAIRGQQWKEMRREYLNSLPNVDEAFPGAAKIAKQLNLAEQVELAKLVKTDPDLAFAYAANLPDAADAVAAKIPADFPDANPFIKETLDHEAFKADNRFVSSTRMTGRGDIFAEGEYNSEALDEFRAILDNKAVKVDDRFVSSTSMTGRGDIFAEGEYNSEALDEFRAILDHEAFKVDDRFVSSTRMTGRGDIFAEGEYNSEALDEFRELVQAMR